MNLFETFVLYTNVFVYTCVYVFCLNPIRLATYPLGATSASESFSWIDVTIKQCFW